MHPVFQQHRDEILTIAARHGAGNVRVFGSLARGEGRPESDVDLLVDIVGPTSAWFPGGLIADLEELLGRPIDVALAGELHRLIRDEVLAEAAAL